MFDTTLFASRDFSITQSNGLGQKVAVVDFSIAVIITTQSQIVFHEIVVQDNNKELILPMQFLYNNKNPKTGIMEYLADIGISSPDIRYLESFSVLPELIETRAHLFGIYQADLQKELSQEYLLTDISGWESIVGAQRIIDALTIASVEKVIKNIYQKKY